MVLCPGRMFGRKILVKSAAEQCIHQLHASADSKNRFILLQGLFKQISLHAVAAFARYPAGFLGRLAIQCRIHVMPAGQKNAITKSEAFLQFFFIFC